MKRVFVQTEAFSDALDDKDPEALKKIEDSILENPEVGDVLKRLGGVRKFRIRDKKRGKGKRGGIRVLYLDLPHRERTYLLYLYGKDEAEDITEDERKEISMLVRILKG